MTAGRGAEPDAILAEPVFAGGRSKPFAELTTAEVRARADELKSATGWGPTAKVGSVALAWSELARLMESTGARGGGRPGPGRRVRTGAEAVDRPARRQPPLKRGAGPTTPTTLS